MRLRTPLLALVAVVTAACSTDDAATGSGAPANAGGAGGASGDDTDAGTTSGGAAGSPAPDAGSTAPPEPMCAESEQGCTCGFSPAIQLGATPRGFGNVGHDVTHDAWGRAVAIWGSEDEGVSASGPLSARVLDPATERWGDAQVLAPRVQFVLATTDGLGRALVLADAADTVKSVWTALEPGGAWRAVEPAPASTAQALLLGSAGTLFAVSPPIVSRLLGDTWTPSTVETAGFYFDGNSLAIEGESRILAAWEDFSGGAPVSGGAPSPAGISAMFYDVASDTWTPSEKLSSTGTSPTAAFDEQGAAHVLWQTGGTFLDQAERVLPAGSPSWSAERPAYGGETVTDGQGRLHRIGVERPGGNCSAGDCTVYTAMFDATADAWTEPVALSTGDISWARFHAFSAGGRAAATWDESCVTTDSCTVRAAYMDATGAWTTTTLGTDAQEYHYPAYPVVVGDDGTAAIAYRGTNAAPEPAYTLFVSRMPPDGGTWSEPVPVHTADNIFFQKLTADPLGNVTVTWEVSWPYDATTGSYTADLWASRYACRWASADGLPNP